VINLTEDHETGKDDIDGWFYKLKNEKWNFERLNEIMDRLKDHAHNIRFKKLGLNNLYQYAIKIGAAGRETVASQYSLKTIDGVNTLVREKRKSKKRTKNDNQHDTTSD
jgi:hypothetical protein